MPWRRKVLLMRSKKTKPNVEELEKIKGPFVYLISTPKGVISMQQAIKKRLGGEVLAKIL